MADENTPLLGKKIFFVHPSPFVQNEIIAEIVQHEHEIYVIKDEEKLKKILKNHPDSIVFSSIDETLSSSKWETWIRSVMGDEATKTVGMGILSNTNNEEARKLYVNTLQVTCGFVPVKLEKNKVIQTLLDILKAANAKGRRKYIRADTRGETMTTINIPNNSEFITGEIRDISVVGLSCVFSQDPILAKNSLLHDMQIKLQSVLVKAEGIVFGSRMEEADKVYVIVFTQKLDSSARTKIRAYVQKNLQSKMDAELK
jgi:hypothetical protein